MQMSKYKINCVRKLISPYRKEYENLAISSVSEHKKRKIIRKQIVNGIMRKLISIVAPAVSNIASENW